MIFLIAEIYQLVGIREERNFRGRGIDSIGNIMPERRITGSIRPIPEINKATSCESAIVEIMTPINKESRIYNRETERRATMLPRIGTPRTYTDMRRLVTRLMQEITKYGMVFAKIIAPGLMGEASRISIVPVSFSRAIEIEVIMAQIKRRIIPRTPGTKL
jgi:hypothetical protein